MVKKSTADKEAMLHRLLFHLQHGDQGYRVSKWLSVNAYLSHLSCTPCSPVDASQVADALQVQPWPHYYAYSLSSRLCFVVSIDGNSTNVVSPPASIHRTTIFPPPSNK
ncbi:hypothetical protein VKT23_006727 [Stygiomarasmius scandens]|uniref:Uncharacterized protein n=1 Tax=Marasmiellus scandens TaxID=2682957 RepID=A0ABR1JKP4_9AGAR